MSSKTHSSCRLNINVTAYVFLFVERQTLTASVIAWTGMSPVPSREMEKKETSVSPSELASIFDMITQMLSLLLMIF